MAAAISAEASSRAETLPWSNLARAQALEADAEDRIAELSEQLAAIDAAIAAARDRPGSSERHHRRRRRRPARRPLPGPVPRRRVVHGRRSALPEAVYLLDAPTANDFAFRSTLLNEGADAVADTAERYLDLRAEASEEAIALSVELDALDRERCPDGPADSNSPRPTSSRPARWSRWRRSTHAPTSSSSGNGRAEPSPQQWAQVRTCESLDDYEINTGNGFFGAYQFELQTWIGVGGTGLPNHALPQEQDARARLLYGMRGAQPWPVCGRYLPGG